MPLVAQREDSSNKKEEHYPCLKEYTVDDLAFVVLFSEPNTGMVVWSSRTNSQNTLRAVGDYSSEWDEPRFEPYHGRITLEY